MKKRNLWMFILVLITLPMIAAIFQNTFTTDSVGRTPLVMTTTTSPMVPLAHMADDSDGIIHINPNVTYTRTNLNLSGNLTNNATRSTNGIFPLDVGASKLSRTDSNTKLAAVTVGTGLSFDGTTLSATGGVAGSQTNTPIVLTLGGTGGTNVSGGDWSLGSASGTTFKLILTTNAFFGATSFSNVPTTNGQQNALLYVYHDSSSTPYTNTWTNSVFSFVNGIAPVQTTNAGSCDVYSLFNDLQTNGQINVVQMNNLRR